MLESEDRIRYSQLDGFLSASAIVMGHAGPLTPKRQEASVFQVTGVEKELWIKILQALGRTEEDVELKWESLPDADPLQGLRVSRGSEQVVIPSLTEMLRNPASKRQAWTALQIFKRKESHS